MATRAPKGTLHFVRSARDRADFTLSSLMPEGIVQVGVVDVTRVRASAMPTPAVQRVILWTTESLAKAPIDVGSRIDARDTYRSCQPLFKSAIQKCVRRGMPDDAARFARALIHAGGLDVLLRRALVILVEDAVALPATPVLVWLMAAHAKGFCLDVADQEYIVDAMRCAAATRVRDCMPREERHADARALLGDAGNHPIVDALLLRVCYGGTPGDMRMLARAASLWRDRLQNSDDCAQWETALHCLNDNDNDDDDDGENTCGDAVTVLPTPEFDASPRGMASLVTSVPIEAADFHCFPRICADVAQATAGRWTPDIVRQAIWHHRSSINLKRPWVDPAAPLALLSTSGDVVRVDDRVDADAVLRTAQCWTAVRIHVDRLARRNIDSVSVGVSSADDHVSPIRQWGQKRGRATADIDKQKATSRRSQPPGPGQRSIRSFFRTEPTGE